MWYSKMQLLPVVVVVVVLVVVVSDEGEVETGELVLYFAKVRPPLHTPQEAKLEDALTAYGALSAFTIFE